MRLMTSKKGMVIYYLVIPGFILALVYFWVLFNQQPTAPLTDFPGELPLYVLAWAQVGEKMLLSVDKMAEYSAYEAVVDVAAHGGFDGDVRCGMYFGYPLWKQDCVPAIGVSIEKFFNTTMQKKMSTFPENNKEIEIESFRFVPNMSVPYYALHTRERALAGAADRQFTVNMYKGQVSVQNLTGVYALRPDFFVVSDYDFGLLKHLTERASSIMGSGIASVDDIKKALEAVFLRWGSRPIWSADACMPENASELFWEAAEHMQDCVDSGQGKEKVKCRCSVARTELRLLGEKYVLLFEQEGSTIALRMKDKRTNERVEEYIVKGDARLGMHKPGEQFSVGELRDATQVMLEWNGRNDVQFQDTDEKDGLSQSLSIFRHKDKRNLVVFVGDSSRTESYNAFGECTPPNKKTLRVCIAAETVPLYNADEELVERVPIHFKVALKLD